MTENTTTVLTVRSVLTNGLAITMATAPEEQVLYTCSVLYAAVGVADSTKRNALVMLTGQAFDRIAAAYMTDDYEDCIDREVAGLVEAALKVLFLSIPRSARWNT